MLTNDLQGMYRQDNHGWLFGWSNGTLFQVRRACHDTARTRCDYAQVTAPIA